MDDLSYALVIPAGGDSMRFKAKGFKEPKGLIKLTWRDKEATMLEHIVGDSNLCYLVVKQEWYNTFLKTLPGNFMIKSIYSTEGQAHTVYQFLFENAFARDMDIVIVNCDNAFDMPLSEFVKQCRANDADCGVMVFESAGETKYGYVNNAPFFQFGKEKVAISPFALAGTFYFKNRSIFLAAHRATNQPIYISDMFGAIKGVRYAYVINRDDLHEWGTPEDILNDKTVTGFKLP